jgi:4-hydroxyphenylpyruvate dioxygenase-like putative hemolysin
MSHDEALCAYAMAWRVANPSPAMRTASTMGADQVRTGDQSQDRSSARPRRAASVRARADEVIE